MFASRYFAPRYFAPRYFPKVGAELIVTTTRITDVILEKFFVIQTDLKPFI